MSKTSEMVTTTGPWLKWAWRYSSLSVDEFASYDEAINAAHYAGEAGEESLECIEGPMGRVDVDVVDRDLRARSDEDFKRFTESPKATHGVKIKSPDGKDEAWFSTFYSKDEAERSATRLRETWGADRVRLFPMP